MASDSPRSRIDQFFASKKRRKSVSPNVKSKKIELDAKSTIEGSPHTKGSLDSFLVSSQENKIPFDAAVQLPSKRIPIKRNLSREISSLSFDVEKKDAISQDVVCSHDIIQKVKSETSTDAGEVENAGLKHPAPDFLSILFRGLPRGTSVPSGPAVHANNMRYSQSQVELENASRKRSHFSQVHLEAEATCFRKVEIGPSESGIIIESRDPVYKNSREFHVGFGEELPQSSLKRCVKASLPVDVVGCTTPGSSIAKTKSHDTPKSGSGSSIFSPGETFWNEAIQIADNLLAPTNTVSSKLPGASVNFNAGKDISPSNNAKDRCQRNNLNNNFLGGSEARGSNAVVSAAVGAEVKHGDDLSREISPLPVKHFDFASEVRNLDGGTTSCENVGLCNVLKAKSTICASHHPETKQVDHTMSLENEVNKSLDFLDLQKKTSKSTPAHNRVSKCIQDSDSYTSKPNDRELSDFTLGVPNQNNTPSSSAAVEGRLDLNNWLPPELCNVYKKRGMSRLYPWQVDCLQVDGVLQNRNLVYCASTSAGKSFVAEILMLRRVLSTGKMALLVLPYVSICAEKAEHLEVLLEPLGRPVRSYYGSQGGGALPKDTSVAVCTIEKANSLINRLLEEGRLSEIGIIVIDELHMVGDQNRGYLLELLLTKLRYATGEGNVELSSGESSGSGSSKADPVHGLQIVGMSATLPNVSAVADWLQAALYETHFRPVPLEEYIKIGYSIYSKEMMLIRTVSKLADIGGKDPDHIVELCNEVVQEGHSVLIFCSSRKGCESTARHVAKYLKKIPLTSQDNQNEYVDIDFAIDALRRSPSGLDPILEETLPAGVAYHHAGLTVEERETVETCYRKGLVRVLTATSTLAAGVNLPARRVIFRQPRIGRDFIDGTRYKQMAGRAGRTGIDTKGESILICKPEETKRIVQLLNDSCPPLHSCLSEDKNGMTHAILEVVAGGIVQSANDIHRYVRCTLLNSTKPFEDVVKSAQDSLWWLCHKRFLEWSEETKLYTTTPLGRASFGSSLSPEESLVVLDDLTRARNGFVLSSDLHLVYLVTPINVDVEPDWELYYERFMQLSALDQSVGNLVGVQEPFLMRMAHGAPVRTSYRFKETNKKFQGKFDAKGGMSDNKMLSDEHLVRVSRRFYVALILSRLVQEIPVAEVCENFRVARGMVQALQENAGRFASMVSVFCERLGWLDLEGLVAKFQNRVSFGVRAEIVELTTIPFVKGSRARALYKAGFRTPQIIAEASISDIAKALYESSSWAAQGSAHRRLHLGVAKKIKNGARKIVLERAEEARVAAFSAFKSLGLDVPLFPRPLLPADAGNAMKKKTISSDEDSCSSFADIKQRKQGNNASILPMAKVGKSSEMPSFASVKTSDRETSASAKGVEIVAAKTLPVSTSNYLNGTSGSNDELHESHQQPELDILPSDSQFKTWEKGPLNASSAPGGFDTFMDLWDNATEFSFDIHFSKRSDINSAAPFEIQGVAVCWENSPVYYVSLPKDLFSSNKRQSDCCTSNVSGDSENAMPDQLHLAKSRWQKIEMIFGKQNVRKFAWNLKVLIQVLKYPAVAMHKFGIPSTTAKFLGLELIDGSHCILSPIQLQNAVDLSLVTWILWPDQEKSSNPNLEKEVKKRLSCEAAAAAHRNGRWKNQMRRAAHNGCCRRAAQTRALSSVLWKLLISEKLVEAFLSIEMPLVNILADMELWGIGVDMEGCLRARNILGKKLKYLEKEAYKLAGKSFSLYMTADIANILYEHLKLPIPEGQKKGKHHPSTDKHCLDMLRNEHPIVPVIKQHRTFAKLLNSTLGSICSLSKLSMRTQRYTLHGHWLQTSTATGRLSMEEPNLQCVEHLVEFKMTTSEQDDNGSVDEYHKINARDFFVPTEDNWILLTADYSQIELRLMAHFSKDPSLIELLNKPDGDVFTMIAAKWARKMESSVSSQERDQTKRLVYGILYGMGASTLAEQMNCSSNEAAERIRSFKASFTGVASWLQEVVVSCRQKGYIKTLKGRKRFLEKIKLGNGKEKSKAQRQAVNSICQGSAADIIKIAMINLHSVISLDAGNSCPALELVEKFQFLQGRCRILLQVHDELVMETDPSVVKEAGLLLQSSMEGAASLLVPLHVKVKVGRTWGSMEPFHAG